MSAGDRGVADRLAAEIREREQLERELERFFELSVDMICVAGFDGYFKRVSPAFEKTLGYLQEELLEEPFLDFLHPDDRESTLGEMERLSAGALTIRFHNRYRCRDGSYRWLTWNAAPDVDRGVIYAIARDTTAEREAVLTTRKARQAAEDANQAKSRFLANMSHELRTPLNSVIGFAGILLKNKRGHLDPQELGYLERILANGKHLLRLINDVLDLSKVEAGQLSVQRGAVDVESVVRDVVAQCEGQVAGKDLTLSLDLPAGLEPIETDGGRLRQILFNLIGNAIKFTAEGSVTVRVERGADGRAARIEVIDTGVGIPEAQLSRIFRPFRQVESDDARQADGSGLGLAITRSLCEALGFRLQVRSRIGKGSTFVVDLGLAEETPPAPDDETGEETPPGRELMTAPASDENRPAVLIIDDDVDSRILLTSMIEELGFDTLVASSGEQGMKMARAFRPALVILDLMMPGKSGWEVLRELKSDPELQSTPVVVVSVLGQEQRGRVIGALDLIQKPVDRRELDRLIRRCMRDRARRVLVVDDEEDTRTILRAYLEEQGLRVVEAENGRVALERVRELDLDLVILDLMMPVMDGMTFLGTLRQDPRHAALPVVVVTARDVSDDELRRLSPAVSVVKKRVELAAGLRRAVEEALAG